MDFDVHGKRGVKRTGFLTLAANGSSGDGYQLWETCTEGSPISPVFATMEELAGWCAVNATIYADDKVPGEIWLQMFRNGTLDVCSSCLMVKKDSGAAGNASR